MYDCMPLTFLKRDEIYYTIENLKTSRSYTCLARDGVPFDDVWESQKHWFNPGTKVRIYDNKGNFKDFVKE